MSNYIVIESAKEHKLKKVDIEKKQISCYNWCSVSGSGKSSITFDTIYA